MNEIDLTALKIILEPLLSFKLPSLRELSLPLNLLQPEGVILFSNACTLGALDSLTLLDISDVGGNSESILVLARALVLRFNCLQLKRLKGWPRSQAGMCAYLSRQISSNALLSVKNINGKK